jgi:hypothetical protein
MHQILKRAPILGTLAFALAVGGCVLITGGTGGYTEGDAGADGSPFGDSGSSCAAAANCNAGQICCLSIDPVTLSAVGSCEPGPTCAQKLQLCTTNAECGDAGASDGGACVRQQCEFGGAPSTFSLCGQVLPHCAAAP